MFFKDIPKEVLDKLAADAAADAMDYWAKIMGDSVTFQFLMSMACLAMYMQSNFEKDWWTKERILQEEIPEPDSLEIAEIRSHFLQFASGWAYLGKMFELEKNWCKENIKNIETMEPETDTVQ